MIVGQRSGRRTAWIATFVVVVALCWLSAGAAPFVQFARNVWQPQDFTPDYVTAVAWVRQGKCGRPWPDVIDRDHANAYARTLGGATAILQGPYFIHPPTALLPIMPLVPLGFRGAVCIWQLAAVALVGVLAWVLAPIAAEAGAPLPPAFLACLLLAWPPVLTNLELGQWSIPLATLMALGHRSWERRRKNAGATWLAMATALKVTPALVLPAVALSDRRAAVRFGAVFLLLAAAALPFGGVSAWLTLLREGGPNTTAWQSFWHNTVSLNGLAVRLFGPLSYAKPLLDSALALRAFRMGVGGALVGVALWGSLVASRGGLDRDAEGCHMALWYLLVPLLTPLGWAHYGVLLLLPAALAARNAARRDDWKSLGLVMVALALASIPKEALFLAARPFPAPAPRSLFLSAHFFAGLLLFVAAGRGVFCLIDKPAALK